MAKLAKGSGYALILAVLLEAIGYLPAPLHTYFLVILIVLGILVVADLQFNIIP